MKSAQATKTQQEAPHLGFLEIMVLVLSVYVLGALLFQTAFQLSPEVNVLLDRIDFLVCLVFLTDFCIRFRRAQSKLAFFKWGWIDLVSSIPAFDFLRWGRLVRVIRIIRILRAFGSTKHLMAFLYRSRAKSLLGTAALSAVVLVIFSCIAILVFENKKDSNIKTPFDAVWWAFSTITTVGYGDKYPVTDEGKIVAIVLMVTGVGLFGVLTGLFARLLVEPELKKEESDIGKLTEEIRLLREKMDQMQRGGCEHPHDPDG
jgi:voltage-gated potassium channel